MKVFLFDIGNVLVDYDYQILIKAIAESSGRPEEPPTAVDLNLSDQVEKGLISDEDYVDVLNETKGLSWTVEDLIGIWQRIFTVNRSGRTLFERATQAGMQVYTLSNIARFHINAIERNWPGFFDGATGLFHSYQLGMRKPNPDIYRHVLDTLGVACSDCFFIDDLPDNIAAARRLGIDAHQYIPANHSSIREKAAGFLDNCPAR